MMFIFLKIFLVLFQFFFKAIVFSSYVPTYFTFTYSNYDVIELFRTFNNNYNNNNNNDNNKGNSKLGFMDSVHEEKNKKLNISYVPSSFV